MTTWRTVEKDIPVLTSSLHTHTHRDTHTHTQTHTETHTHKHTHRDTQTYIHTHTDTHTQRHTYMCIHTHMHTSGLRAWKIFNGTKKSTKQVSYECNLNEYTYEISQSESFSY